jgi:uncharacterized 2Fe-2S/4Fe-4S cluster protein (DUF4445 family)
MRRLPWRQSIDSHGQLKVNLSLHLEIESVKGHQQFEVATAERRALLTELLRSKHLPLNTRCGQRGLCEGCIVELLSGRLTRTSTGQVVEATGEPVSLRACECRLAPEAGARIRIPPRSLLAYEPQVVSDFRIQVPRAHDPLWQQIEISRAEIRGDGEWAARLCRAVARRTNRRRPVRIAPSVRAIGSCDRVYATAEYRHDHWLITDASGRAVSAPLGAAVDIGTTTVAVLLVDLRDSRVLGSAGNFNCQMHLGDDVLTRINLCSVDPAMTPRLQELILKETIAPLLAEVLAGAGASPDQLRCLSVAGNMTMLHLFGGVNPSSIGMAPFRPVFLSHRVLHGAEEPFQSMLGAPCATIHLLPGAAAYVGADLTAGAFATGLVYDEGPSLLVDVGTNGEIILKRGDRLYACATAAGPAFEGAGLTNGVRAAEGAVSHIRFARNPFRLETEKIGKHSAIGLCGTAYIDLLAEGRKIGLLNTRGRIDQQAVAAASGYIIRGKDGDLALRIASGAGNTDIVATEADIAHLLQAKAAVAAGMLTLLARTGVVPNQIKTLYLAGGFGLHLIRENAIGCGLLPGFTTEQVELVGNSSLAGAYLALVDCGALDEITRIGQRMEVVELNLDPQFESRFIDQLSLPE